VPLGDFPVERKRKDEDLLAYNLTVGIVLATLA
jgi:hypothetical protein